MIVRPLCLILFLFFLVSSKIYADEKILYLDMQYIMNNSFAGKSIISQLDKKQKNFSIKYKDLEVKLKEEEIKLVSQKNILIQKEFLEKIDILKKKIKAHNTEKAKTLDLFNKQKIKAKNQLTEELMQIISNYAVQNSTSLILKKQSIVIGKSTLEITDDILKILDNSVKNIKIK